MNRRSFGVYDLHMTQEDRRRFDLRALAQRLRNGSAKTKDLTSAATKLEMLADYPGMLSVLGERSTAPDVYHWLAYHALVCEKLGIGTRERVADFWHRSTETVQDALTERRAGLVDSVGDEIAEWLQQGFSPGEVLDSLEETRLAAAREFVLSEKRRRKAKRRKK